MKLQMGIKMYKASSVDIKAGKGEAFLERFALARQSRSLNSV